MNVLQLVLIERIVLPILKSLALAFEAYAKQTPDGTDDLLAGLCVALITALENQETIKKLKEIKT